MVFKFEFLVFFTYMKKDLHICMLIIQPFCKFFRDYCQSCWGGGGVKRAGGLVNLSDFLSEHLLKLAKKSQKGLATLWQILLWYWQLVFIYKWQILVRACQGANTSDNFAEGIDFLWSIFTVVLDYLYSRDICKRVAPVMHKGATFYNPSEESKS